MRVALCVAVFVMLQMELGIGLRMQKGGSLRDKGEQIEKSFPEWTHRKHAVSHIAVQEETLGEYARIPVNHKKADDDQHGSTFSLKVSVDLDSFAQDVVRHAPFRAIFKTKELRAS